MISLEPRPRPAIERRVLVIGDCENDSVSVEASLRFVGLLDKQRRFSTKTCGIQIVQTGDFLFKNSPSPAVVGFWEGLGRAAALADCCLHLVAGNHELEIWRRLQAGDRMGLSRQAERGVQALIRRTSLFHVVGSMLFMHGYPTLALLRHLRDYRRDTGRGLNDYNQDHFHPAFGNARQLARYAYPRGGLCRTSLLHDVADPERYYRRHGREVADLLGALGIELVVHGHRPERSGVQADYELGRWLPGIRMINNDVQLRLQGPGATLIRQVEHGPTDVRFVNRGNATLAHRTDVRRLLRAPAGPAEIPLSPRSRRLEGPVASFVRGRDFGVPTLAAEIHVATR